MEKCKICGKEFKSFRGGNFTVHLRTVHSLTTKEYYDKFLKSENEEKCAICNRPTKFLSLNLGYREFCRKCSYKEAGKKVSQTKLNYSEDKKQEIKQKRETTVYNRYGVNCYLASKEVQEKSHSKEVRQKAVSSYKQTMLEKYGVDNYFKTDKARESCQTDEAKAKRRQSFIETTGVDSPRKIKGVDELIKETNLKKYGYESFIEYANNIGITQQIKNDNITQFEIDNDCTLLHKLVEKYGQGWYKSNIIDFIYNGPQRAYVKNSDIPLIEKYVADNYLAQSSMEELHLKETIKSFYSESLIENSRKIITPYELDIYLPKHNLAIEFNGLYYHSIEKGTPKEYHLNKSLMCREKGIRLIHIYEFEDFKEQIKLLEELIVKGVDNYPKNDFNKNNLIEKIPKPEIIYSNRYTVYGSGKLM